MSHAVCLAWSTHKAQFCSHFINSAFKFGPSKKYLKCLFGFFFVCLSTGSTICYFPLSALGWSSHYFRWNSPWTRRWFVSKENRSNQGWTVQSGGGYGYHRNWNHWVSPNRHRGIRGSIHRAGGVYRRWPPKCRDGHTCQKVRLQSICGVRHHGLRQLHPCNLLPYIRRYKIHPEQPSFRLQCSGVRVGAGGIAVSDRRVCFCIWSGAGSSHRSWPCCLCVHGVFGYSAIMLPRNLASHAAWDGESSMAASRMERTRQLTESPVGPGPSNSLFRRKPFVR